MCNPPRVYLSQPPDQQDHGQGHCHADHHICRTDTQQQGANAERRLEARADAPEARMGRQGVQG